MKTFFGLLFLIFGLFLTVRAGFEEELAKTTADRIREHGYPAEIHQVETEDNYVIKLFRIPYSHKLQNQNQTRPAVLLQHGLLSCSDAWILNGPNDALAFLMADAGYDVFLGNVRGNRYSRNNTRLSTNHPYFWRYSWHEIGYYDVSAMIDYILETTKQSKLHYIGISQGTTVFFVLMSMRPEYNEKIKTAHTLAPVAFMSNLTNTLIKTAAPIFGYPNQLSRFVEAQEILPSTMFFLNIYENYCKKDPNLAFICSNLYYIWTGNNGGENSNMNMTIAAHLNETHPAGASSSQVLHFLQEYNSGRFCQYDHGEKQNLKKYGQPMPPDYDISKITANLYLYYADNDDLADTKDVEYLISLLPNVASAYHVPDPTFNHDDFAFSVQVKEVINDRVINACNAHEDQFNRIIFY